MQIGLFGGTFDPPHRAHTTLVETFIANGLFDQVWYLPVAIHQTQFNKQHMSSVRDRLAMLKLVQTNQTRIETYEIDSHKPSHTHSTLRALQQHYPQHTFSFVMGADQLPKLHLWNCDQDEHCFPEAADEFKYYIYPRLGFNNELPYANLHLITGVEPMAYSSTDVRYKVSHNQPIADLVNDNVYEYIQQHQLYTKS
jgi:nicotinate-nucleotide adenylyltransferase